ncbi:MAG: hypothetical protein ACN4GW_21800 [Desulforhopalus sp.]
MAVTVQPLKKLKLYLTAGGSPGSGPGRDPVGVEFIFGIASDGLSPFERALSGKKQGDILSLSVASAEAQGYFGRCLGNYQQLLGLPIMPATIYVTVEVADILDAENREVVQSLAKSLSHGCGGSCDCGCS